MLSVALQHIWESSDFATCSRIASAILLTVIVIQWLRILHTSGQSPKQLLRIGLSTLEYREDCCNGVNAADEMRQESGKARIKAIFIYPIKSCMPIRLESATLNKAGLEYDRSFAWAVETDNKCQFLSQRTKPQMSLIHTELWLPDRQSDPEDDLVKLGGCLIVEFPDPDPPGFADRICITSSTRKVHGRSLVRFKIPLFSSHSSIMASHLPIRQFRIHHRMASGYDLGNLREVATVLPKLKRFLGIPAQCHLTLMKCMPDTLTRTDRNLAPLENIGSPAVHGYTDQQPVHIVNLPSVHATSALLPLENQPLNALRFRANIYIEGVPAFSEESWKRYKIVPKVSSNVDPVRVAPVLSVVCRTSRCTMPNVDPARGEFERDNPSEKKPKGRPQPSTTLKQYRTVENGNPAALGFLGMHCVPEDTPLYQARHLGVALAINVGDEIEVIDTGTHLYGSTGNDY